MSLTQSEILRMIPFAVSVSLALAFLLLRVVPLHHVEFERLKASYTPPDAPRRGIPQGVKCLEVQW